MCGIAGIFPFHNAQPPITQELLKGMSDAIAHRGPDDEGHFVDARGRVGLAFRRLSIIDLSPAGHQPMSTPDGSVWIVFNGEIYNHLRLRAELEAAGYRYRSRSDTETLLYAYQHWGERFVERLEGMFGIALWDAEKDVLILYRDRIGIKPVYYAEKHGQVIFGSEIKALLAHPALSPALDREAFHHYLTYIHTPAPSTMFEGVRKLEAGHYLRLTRGGGMDDVEYWDPLQAPETDFDYTDEAAVTARIRALFEEAVSKRMMSDVPFGVFLSGGIDSSANVAFMARMMDRPVDTFTVAIKGQEDTNEFQWARRISALHGTNHHEVIIDDAGFLELMPTVVYHQDEPLADPVCFPLYHVSKLARDNGTIVIQVGEGSDEQFAGYQSYLRGARLSEQALRYGRAMLPARRALYRAMIPALKRRRVDYRQNVIRNLFEGDPVFWGNAVAFYSREKARVESADFRAGAAYPDSYTLAHAKYERIRNWGKATGCAVTPLDEIIYWELKNRLAELLLMRVDKITMAVSLEARVPFLDHKLVEFSMHIPAAMKTRGGVTKAILKKALRGVLPDEIIDRKKIGFAGSGKNMLTPGIYKHAREVLLTGRHGLFDLAYVRGLLDEYERTRINYTPQIWALYNFELWHRRWIEGDRALSL
ncbi:MAG: asparagine synthase (glutamine-hydrolyzing) [Ignavibacteria bacterium]|nr:asparagine synthase (glutamine-hydrolyzing) [Ignavibacteria bacterium]